MALPDIAIMLHLPVFTPRTRPSRSTVATEPSLVLHFTVSSPFSTVAESFMVSNSATAAVSAEIFTMVLSPPEDESPELSFCLSQPISKVADATASDITAIKEIAIFNNLFFIIVPP